MLKLKDISKHFTLGGLFFGKKVIKAIDGVSLSITHGQILSLVGESGCGKSTLGKIAAGLLKPTSGQVLYDGTDIWGENAKSGEAFKKFRRDVQIILQDPYSSLNPYKNVYQTLSTPLLKHKIVEAKSQTREKVAELLEMVGLTPPEEFIEKYPHQLSGGQRQRVAIARSISVSPKVLIADEPVSMIDVSLRLSILNILSEFKRRLGLSLLFITHDLAVGKYIAWDGVMAVMYLGTIVELGETSSVIKKPLHPYTQALMSVVPEPDPKLTRSKQRFRLRSLDVPSLLNPPKGCLFHPRCPLFMEGLCDGVRPKLIEVEKRHYVACYLYSEELGRQQA